VENTYQTERLLLQATSIDDASFILALVNTPKWIKYIGERNVHTEADAKNYIQEKILPQMARLGFGNYTMIRKSDGAKLGTCGLYDRDGLEGIDIGFALLPDYEKMGYAFEAAQKVKSLAFDTFGIKTMVGITSKKNLASQKLLLKLGLQLAGTTILPNDTEELFLYRLNSCD